ncbi:hypothetical protein Cgig2_029214 [Carnegiea gigantea]|uniref:CCT domain-containing protein n=1 Tax=Carnegiea gigantea TaxID=171969 RepID=A0A9Q1QM09_9CARY|nr:hypothetical protein Cgig2_029214 [Carnegiea gigantea]
MQDHISSPINAQIFDFCDPDIFNDALQNSEVTSSDPNCCSYEDQNSSYATNLSFPSNMTDDQNNRSDSNKFIIESLDISNFQGGHNDHTTNASTTCSTPTTTITISASTHHHDGAFLFESQDDIDNDISASIDFSPSPSFATAPYNFNNLSSTPSTNHQCQQHYQLPLGGDQHANMTNNNNGFSQYPTTPVDPSVLPLMVGHAHAPLGMVFEDDCLSPIPPFLRFNPSTVSGTSSSSSCSSFLDRSMGSFLPGNMNHGLGSDNSGIFAGNLLISSELQGKELDHHGDNNGGIFCHDQLPRMYNSGDMQQAFSNESSQLVSAATSSAPLATEISSLSEDSTFKAGKLTVEQRKEKISRYMKKRNERNFSKKIKFDTTSINNFVSTEDRLENDAYVTLLHIFRNFEIKVTLVLQYACRKTLADSRPRVRGRFAKNDDFGDANHRHINGHHLEEDDYDEVQVKEEGDLVASSGIFSHISGVNSFKCNYQIQSWI